MKFNKLLIIYLFLALITTVRAQAPDADNRKILNIVTNIKRIKVGEDTIDDVIKLMGKPIWQGNFKGNKILQFCLNPNIRVWFDASGHTLGVEVQKMTEKGNEDVYVKGVPIGGDVSSAVEAKNSENHFPLKDAPPDNPTEGQYYFNTTDKHAYLWNSVAWVQLDKP